MHDGLTRKVNSVEPMAVPAFLEAHRASLTIMGGPMAGMEFELTGMRTILGRSAKAGIRLDDDSISAEHASLELDAHGFGVRDLASTNGVRVNGKEVLSQSLEHGDRIQLGAFELQYVLEHRTPRAKTWSLESDD